MPQSLSQANTAPPGCGMLRKRPRPHSRLQERVSGRPGGPAETIRMQEPQSSSPQGALNTRDHPLARRRLRMITARATTMISPAPMANAGRSRSHTDACARGGCGGAVSAPATLSVSTAIPFITIVSRYCGFPADGKTPQTPSSFLMVKASTAPAPCSEFRCPPEKPTRRLRRDSPWYARVFPDVRILAPPPLHQGRNHENAKGII